MTSTSLHHKVLIVGGGSAGIDVAARLRRAKVADIGGGYSGALVA